MLSQILIFAGLVLLVLSVPMFVAYVCLPGTRDYPAPLQWLLGTAFIVCFVIAIAAGLLLWDLSVFIHTSN